MNSLGLGAKNTNVKNIISSETPNFLISAFGSYVTLALTVLLFGMVFALIYIYFKTVGYTIETGWEKLMNVFYKKEEIDITTTEGKKETGSLTLTPPMGSDGPESMKLKEILGITPPSPKGKPDLGFEPPSATGTLPFNPEERPIGMPGAREASKDDKKKRKKKRRSKSPDSDKNQVFNVSRNLYIYEEAAPLCKAMGAELATYEQVADAQKGGADWCNYGWTKGQMAIYPTSKKTWTKLQAGPSEHRNSCGKPGVNGGFFDNPELRFGVNCFGPKPNKRDTDELLNDTDMAVPPTAEQIEFDKKVEKFREQIGNVSILPWNRKKWAVE